MRRSQYSKSILGLANQIRRLYNLSTGNNGSQTRILYYVLENFLTKDIYQKDIEEEMNICSSGISAVLKKLEEQNLIVREKVSYDDRLKRIRPTSLALDRKEKVDEDIRLIEKRLTAGIDKKKLDIFFEVMQKMEENMDEKERVK